jgi:hypothetical protein
MAEFYYSVTATLPDEPTAQRFIDWLAHGHIADVVKAGARSGRAIRLDPGGDAAIRVETQYVFASRAAYEAYDAGPAVALRAEGVEKFGDAGVAFERRTGETLVSIADS